MRAMALNLRHELIGLGGVVERNVYLTRRYIWWDLAFFVWTVANTLTIVFIAKGIEATGGSIDVEQTTTAAADRRRRLGVPRDHLRVHHGDGRLGALGGDDRVHVHGAALTRDAPRRLGRVRGALRPRRARSLLFVVVAMFFGLSMPDANFAAAFVILLIASVSFFGIGMMTAVLPLISPEKGAQLGFVAQGHAARRLGRLLPGLACCRSGCSGSRRSRRRPTRCAGSAARSSRAQGLLWANVWPLIVIGVVSIPLGLVGVQARRDLREEARQAEAVGMIVVRTAETDADLEAWRRVRIAVLPNERAASIEEMRRTETADRLMLLAELDGEVDRLGGRRRSRTSPGPASSRPRVLEAARRRGVGTALLRALADHVHRLGYAQAGANVDDPGSLAFAERFGFREVDRQVEQVRVVLDDEPDPAAAGRRRDHPRRRTARPLDGRLRHGRRPGLPGHGARPSRRGDARGVGARVAHASRGRVPGGRRTARWSAVQASSPTPTSPSAPRTRSPRCGGTGAAAASRPR